MNTTTLTPLQAALNHYMDLKGWKAAHLSAALLDLDTEVSTWSIDRWLAGKNEPRARQLGAIAEALGVTANDLLGYQQKT